MEQKKDQFSQLSFDPFNLHNIIIVSYLAS